MTDELVPYDPEEARRDFEQLLAVARGEVARRIRSPQARAKIPAATLFSFVINATKLLAAIDVAQPPAQREQAQATHVLTLLGDRGLPVERQADLLQSFIEEVGEERAVELGLTAALDILVGKQEASKRLAIEGEADEEADDALD